MKNLVTTKRVHLIIIAAACCAGAIMLVKPKSEARSVSLDTAVVRAETVSEPEKRARGLSGRESLDPGSGMLFVFDREGIYPFWMKDMRFSIDIIWMDSEKRVTHIARDVPPESYPDVFAPPSPSRYVLEVPAGHSDRRGITRGSVGVWEEAGRSEKYRIIHFIPGNVDRMKK